ncbi:hypothetical protein HYH02_002013 [Chlamydomonas schloesseri]|uniref:Uncharacterized protein n=1 Tax=Chlamydomonas schloesseri TaxID=2026947 RepID=A0A835WUC8_9CHLO|nr:hypothetical protein HYH02_002013 [Chlamydomonas schloesseri]|eukprot:KAG2453806.1 hypothetical protein HYH02_002013 [Chlamydomonas schloesseri]
MSEVQESPDSGLAGLLPEQPGDTATSLLAEEGLDEFLARGDAALASAVSTPAPLPGAGTPAAPGGARGRTPASAAHGGSSNAAAAGTPHSAAAAAARTPLSTSHRSGSSRIAKPAGSGSSTTTPAAANAGRGHVAGATATPGARSSAGGAGSAHATPAAAGTAARTPGSASHHAATPGSASTPAGARTVRQKLVSAVHAIGTATAFGRSSGGPGRVASSMSSTGSPANSIGVGSSASRTPSGTTPGGATDNARKRGPDASAANTPAQKTLATATGSAGAPGRLGRSPSTAAGPAGGKAPTRSATVSSHAPAQEAALHAAVHAAAHSEAPEQVSAASVGPVAKPGLFSRRPAAAPKQTGVAAVKAAELLQCEGSAPSLTLPTVSGPGGVGAEDDLGAESLESYLENDPALNSWLAATKDVAVPGPSGSAAAAAAAGDSALPRQSSDELLQPLAAAMAATGVGGGASLLDDADDMDMDNEMNMMMQDAAPPAAVPAQAEGGPDAASPGAPKVSTGGVSNASDGLDEALVAGMAAEAAAAVAATSAAAVGSGGSRGAPQLSSEEMWRSVKRQASGVAMLTEGAGDAREQELEQARQQQEELELAKQQREQQDGVDTARVPASAGAGVAASATALERALSQPRQGPGAHALDVYSDLESDPNTPQHPGRAVPLGTAGGVAAGVAAHSHQQQQQAHPVSRFSLATPSHDGAAREAADAEAEADEEAEEHMLAAEAEAAAAMVAAGGSADTTPTAGSRPADELSFAAAQTPVEAGAAATVAVVAATAAAIAGSTADADGAVAGTVAGNSGGGARPLQHQSSSASSVGFDAAVAFEASMISRQLAGGNAGGGSSFGARGGSESGYGARPSAGRAAAYAAVEEGDEELAAASPSGAAPGAAMGTVAAEEVELQVAEEVVVAADGRGGVVESSAAGAAAVAPAAVPAEEDHDMVDAAAKPGATEPEAHAPEDVAMGDARASAADVSTTTAATGGSAAAVAGQHRGKDRARDVGDGGGVPADLPHKASPFAGAAMTAAATATAAAAALAATAPQDRAGGVAEAALPAPDHGLDGTAARKRARLLSSSSSAGPVAEGLEGGSGPAATDAAAASVHSAGGGADSAAGSPVVARTASAGGAASSPGAERLASDASLASHGSAFASPVAMAAATTAIESVSAVGNGLTRVSPESMPSDTFSLNIDEMGSRMNSAAGAPPPRVAITPRSTGGSATSTVAGSVSVATAAASSPRASLQQISTPGEAGVGSPVPAKPPLPTTPPKPGAPRATAAAPAADTADGQPEQPLLQAWQVLAPVTTGGSDGAEAELSPLAAAGRAALGTRTSMRSMRSISSRLSRVSSHRDEEGEVHESVGGSPAPSVAGAATVTATAALGSAAHSNAEQVSSNGAAVGAQQQPTAADSSPFLGGATASAAAAAAGAVFGTAVPVRSPAQPGRTSASGVVRRPHDSDDEDEEHLVPAWKMLRSVTDSGEAAAAAAASAPTGAGASAGSASTSVTGGGGAPLMGRLGSRRSLRNIPVSSGGSRLQRSTSRSTSLSGVVGEAGGVVPGKSAPVTAAARKAALGDDGSDDDDGVPLPPAWKVLSGSASGEAAVNVTPEVVAAARGAPLGSQPSFRSGRTGSSRLHRSSAADAEDFSFVNATASGSASGGGAPAATAATATGGSGLNLDSDGTLNAPAGLAASSRTRSQTLPGSVSAGAAALLAAKASHDSLDNSGSHSLMGAGNLASATAAALAPSPRGAGAGLPSTSVSAGQVLIPGPALVLRSPVHSMTRGVTGLSGGSSFRRSSAAMDGAAVAAAAAAAAAGHGTVSESGSVPGPAAAAMLAARVSSRRLMSDSVGSVPLPQRSSCGADPNVDALRPAWQVLPLAVNASQTGEGGTGSGAASTPSAANMLGSLRSSSRLSRMSSGIPEELLAELRLQAQAAVGHLQGPAHGEEGAMVHTDGLDSVDDEEARLPPGVNVRTSSGAGSIHHHSPHQPAAAAATPAAGDGAGGVVHAWKVLPPRVPAPSTSGLGPGSVGTAAAAAAAASSGGADAGAAPPPPALGNMPAPMRMSFGGRPTLAATRAGNASSRLAVASQPKAQVTFDASSPSVRSSGHEPTIEEESAGPGAPSGAVDAAAALAEEEERPSTGSGAGGSGPAAPPPTARLPPMPNDDAVVHAWKLVAPVSPAAAAPPPPGAAGAGVSPQESGGVRPPAQHVLGSRASLKSMRSGSMTGSRLSRNSSVRHEDYVDDSYSQLVGGGPSAGPDHISPADSANQRAVAAAAAAAAVAVSAAANPAYPANAAPGSGSAGGAGGAAAGGRGSDRTSAPAAIGPSALPPGVLYGRMGGSARITGGSGSGSSSSSSGGGAAAADGAAGGVPFRPPLTRSTTTGSLDVPTALSQEPGGLPAGSEAALARVVAARGSVRSRTSASGSSRLSRMSSARDGAPGAPAASPWDLGDIREEDAEGSINLGERVGSPSGPANASGTVLDTRRTTASGGSITAGSGVISAVAHDALSGGAAAPPPARLSGSGAAAKPAGLQLSRCAGDDDDDDEVLEPAWKVLGPAAASGEVGSTGGAGSSHGGAAAGGLMPHSQLSTPGSARRSLKSLRSNSLGSSRLSRMTSQISDMGLEDIVEEGAGNGNAAAAAAAAEQADSVSGHSGNMPERVSAGRAPPPAPSAGAARIGAPVGSSGGGLGQLGPAAVAAAGVAKPAAAAATAPPDEQEEPLVPAWKVLAPRRSADGTVAGAAAGAMPIEATAAELSPSGSAPGMLRQASLRSMRSGSLGHSRLSRMTSGSGAIEEAGSPAAATAAAAAAAVATAAGAAVNLPAGAPLPPGGAADASASAPGGDSLGVRTAGVRALAAGSEAQTAPTSDISNLTLADMPNSSKIDRGSTASAIYVGGPPAAGTASNSFSLPNPSAAMPPAAGPPTLLAAAGPIKEEEAGPGTPASSIKQAPSPVAAAAEAASAVVQGAVDAAAASPSTSAPAPPATAERSAPAVKPEAAAAAGAKPVQQRGGFLSCFACFGKPKVAE